MQVNQLILQPEKTASQNLSWLAEIPKAPKELYIAGEMKDFPLIAVVGSRHPSDYGRAATYRLAYDLARAGVGIVSGLAIGVDTIAHEAALEAGGYTIAVLGSGHDKLYPSRNSKLAEQIVGNGGAVISEYPADTPPLPAHFPKRNRIVAALCRLTLVTEANVKSGSLITARLALESDRIVAAVPGPITSPLSAGPNNLLKNGAAPITDAADILSLIDIEASNSQAVATDSPEEASLLALLAKGVDTTDELIRASQLTAGRFASIISLMEISGKVRSVGAGRWLKL